MRHMSSASNSWGIIPAENKLFKCADGYDGWKFWGWLNLDYSKSWKTKPHNIWGVGNIYPVVTSSSLEQLFKQKPSKVFHVWTWFKSKDENENISESVWFHFSPDWCSPFFYTPSPSTTVTVAPLVDLGSKLQPLRFSTKSAPQFWMSQ